MDLRDFIVTPFIIMAVYALAYYLRPRLCDENNYRYFFPALTVKILGALAVGFIYQFYYDGGDTFNFHTRGSRVIWEAFVNDPVSGLKLIFAPGDPHLYNYVSRVEFYYDPSSFFIVRLAALFDLVTFSTYSGTAVIFAFISFLGLWFFFRTFCEEYPDMVAWIAICTLFVPSVVFWGSGILKDTVVLACLGFATYNIKKLFIDKRVSFGSIVVLVITLVVIFEVKKYVLLCFLPAAIFWIYTGNLQRVRTPMLRIILLPVIILITIVSGLFVAHKVGENDPRFALDRIAETAKITAYDIGFYSGRNAGSSYSLGELDGSFGSMLVLFPQAVNVSLFRPYLWEVQNPLMALSAIEALVMLGLTLYLLFRRPLAFFRSINDPTVLFCLLFSLTFAFAVGISTYNFGTLVRYKIPLMPFYLVALVIIADRSKRDRNVEELEITE